MGPFPSKIPSTIGAQIDTEKKGMENYETFHEQSSQNHARIGHEIYEKSFFFQKRKFCEHVGFPEENLSSSRSEAQKID